VSEVFRGQVYLAKHPDLDEKKFFLVVSNNKRNKILKTVLCVRITSTDKVAIPTCVQIPDHEGIAGFAVCDDVYIFMNYELDKLHTSLTDRTMVKVEQALKIVFAIRG
jgi:mRNA interferase MazF